MKMLRYILIAGATALMFAAPILAIDIPGGTVSGTWLADSTYRVLGNITVPNDSILDIQPGVQVQFAGKYRITVNGILRAVGTSVDSISFLPADTAVGWRGIDFNSTYANDTSRLIYSKVQYAKCDTYAVIYVHNSITRLVIEHCNISYNNRTYNYSGGFVRSGTIYITAMANAGVRICNNVISRNVLSNPNTGTSAGAFGAGISVDNPGSNKIPKIYGNLIHGNSVLARRGYGGGMFLLSCKATVSNNTIVGNHADSLGGGAYIEDCSPRFVNNIIRDNTAGSGPQVYFYGSGTSYDPLFYHCNIQGGKDSVYTRYSAANPGAYGFHKTYHHCVDTDAVFADTAAGDFRLQSTSRCIDAGTPDAWRIPGMADTTVNAYFNVACNGTHFDMGGLESGTTVLANVLPGTDVCGGAIGNGTWTKADSPYCVLGYSYVPKDTLLTIEAGARVLFEDAYRFQIEGRMVAQGAEGDSIRFEPADTVTGWQGLYFTNASPVRYQPNLLSYCVVTHKNYSWPAVTLRDNVVARIEHCDISHNRCWSASGSLWGGGMQIVNSDSVWVLNSTISDNLIANIGYEVDGAGICIYNSDCRIEGNLISGNRFIGTSGSGYGGGIYAENCSLTVRNNTIIGNETNYRGAGICLSGSSVRGYITNNLILRNRVWNSNNGTNVAGGGLYCYYGNAVIANNTIAENSADPTGTTNTSMGGGFYTVNASAQPLINNIFWNNKVSFSRGSGPEVFIASNDADPNFYYCDVKGGTAGFGLGTGVTFNGADSNCLDVNPLFADTVGLNYHLKTASPLIGAGTPDGWFIPGQGRTVNSAVGYAPTQGVYEIGAFEHYGIYPPALVTPLHGQFISDNTPALRWTDQDSAVSYRVQVDSTGLSAFGPLFVDQLVAADSLVCPPLNTANLCAWRVKAYDTHGDSTAWSSVREFTVDVTPPDPPTAITANGANPSPWRSVNTVFSIDVTAPVDPSGIARFPYKLGTSPVSSSDTSGSGYTAGPFWVDATTTGGQSLYVWARDNAGNENHINWISVRLRYDNLPPTGAAAAAPISSYRLTFPVTWTAGSDAGGSGLTGRYWIKRKLNGGVWTDLDTNYLGTSYSCTTAHDDTVRFEVAAKDSAGNVEAFSGAAECSTVVDTTKFYPALRWPGDNADLNDNTPAFAWYPMPDLDTFQVQCAYDVGFSALALSQTIFNDTVFTPGSPLADSLYYWRVRGFGLAYADTSKWSPTRALRIDTQAPAAPSLASPASDTLSNDNTPSLDWGDVPTADRYRLQVQRAADSAVVVDSVVTVSAHTLAALSDGRYFWLVRAGDAAGNWSGLSASRYLRIDTQPPSVPVLAYPDSGLNTPDNTPTLTWRTSATAVRYRLQFAAAPDFTPVLMDTVTTDTSCTITNNIADGDYYWRVSAVDSALNWSAYSQVRSVTVTALFTILGGRTPANGATVAPGTAVSIRFSKAVNTADLTPANIHITGSHLSPFHYTTSYDHPSRQLLITPDTGFAACDTIVLVLKGGLHDSLNATTLDGNADGVAQGDSTDDDTLRFYTGMLGDYNLDGFINTADITRFVLGWSSYSRAYETGPFAGIWPHLSPVVSGPADLDFEDVAGLAACWNYADNGKIQLPAGDHDDGPVALEWPAAGRDGLEVIAVVRPGADLQALDGALFYDQDKFSVRVLAGQRWQSPQRPALLFAKKTAGECRVSAAGWPDAKSAARDLFLVQLAGRPGPADELVFAYNIYGPDGAIAGSGRTRLNLFRTPRLPNRFDLAQAYPNPARARASINYQLPVGSRVRLEVYNIMGQRIKVLADGDRSAGYYSAAWDLTGSSGRAVAAGIYLYKLTATPLVPGGPDGRTFIRKLAVAR
ncbi:MAG: FlgD immunoglobulin-like domain containing protein [Candidatus Edwardsbacteria bacterium]|nr:FlgD immunoglobulin-like domain containing protein [Candidatus Edwardsbacteria bacterium]